MDNWLIKAKPTYEEVVAKLAKLAKAGSELATLKEANAQRGTSSMDKALEELSKFPSWAAEIATARSLTPGDCIPSVIEFGAAFDSSKNDTVLPEVTELLPGFACSLDNYEATFASHHAFRTAAPINNATTSNWEDEIKWCTNAAVTSRIVRDVPGNLGRWKDLRRNYNSSDTNRSVFRLARQ